VAGVPACCTNYQIIIDEKDFPHMSLHLRKCLLLLLLFCASSGAYSLEDKTFCVWDPVGRSGPVMTFYSDVIPKAQAWGLNIRFVAYTEELQAVEDFKKGKCEAAVLTSILSRQFVKFAGTMDAVGAINSDKALELAIATFARSLAGNLMVDGDYEVFTTFPVGSMYAFVKDREINTIDKFKDKTLAILNNDPQMLKFAQLAGSKPVNVKLSTFAEKFNKGNLDILIMPALAYNTFELYEGLSDKGGIINYRLYYGMLQTIAKRNEFPEGTGDKMRGYMLNRMNEMNKMVKDAEEEIPSHYWIDVNQFVKDNIDHFSTRVRMQLAEDNVNSEVALKLFWKIRCRMDPSRAECKADFPEVSSKQRVAQTSVKQSAPAVRQETPVKQAKTTLANQTKEIEQEIARQKQVLSELEKINAGLQNENNRLLTENKEFRALVEMLEEEKKVLENNLLEMQQQMQRLQQIQSDSSAQIDVQQGTAADAMEQASVTEDNTEMQSEETDSAQESASTDQDVTQSDEEEEKGGFWNFLFGWI
jgi:hypothetical protein